MLFRSEIGADTHVHHRDLPLRVVVARRRARVVAALAVLRPKLGAALFCRAG